ncbi:MAG: hypothetical protein IJZ51_04695 [Ruminiclostridium sp.]|nr:hypothetical protein [Ruminiclostridium sp.]
MSLFDKLRRRSRNKKPSLPSREETIKQMYKEKPDKSDENVTEYIYSMDRTMRYELSKRDNCYTYELWKIEFFDEEEWLYISSFPDSLPAAWVPARRNDGKSFFHSKELMLSEIKSEYEYKKYFEKA